MTALKRITSILLAFSLVFCLAACGGGSTPTDGNDGAQPQGSDVQSTEGQNDASAGTESTEKGGDDTTMNNQTTTSGATGSNAEYGKVVICIGDSITEGMGMDKEDRYPSVLGAHLEGQYTVLNAGVGGEKTHAIMSRLNAIDFTVSKQIVFGKGETELEYDWTIFSGMNGEEIKYRYGVMGRDLPITKLTIDGKPYTMRFEKGTNEESGKYILCREDDSEIVKIPVGAKVQYDYSDIYEENYCTVLLMGANGGWNNDINELIDGYKNIAATAKNFIAIIPHYGIDYTAEFEAAFGNKCVSLRGYANGSLYEDYNIEKTQIDTVDLAAGLLPRTLTYQRNKGDCHLNEQGYKILGDLVYKKGVELGYWK